MEYPAEFQGASEERIAELGVGKIITLTSTYDHRIIQGAESGDFLRTHPRAAARRDDFFDEIFRELRHPVRAGALAHRQPRTRSIDKNARVIELIDAYRTRGHLMADIDPLRLDKTRFRSHPDLDVLTHGLTLWDLDREFKVDGFAGAEYMKLRDVLGAAARLRTAATSASSTCTSWTPSSASGSRSASRSSTRSRPSREQKYILAKLNAAEAFETFLQTKYVGQKRFSLEGAETVIPMMDAALDQAAEHGLDEVVIGMPHRGRLNVLANIVGKPYSQIFREFEGNLNPSQAHGSGDVKYHLGAERQLPADVRRQRHRRVAGRQPVTPRGRRPGAGGHRPGQAGPAGQGRRTRRVHRDAADAARRRGVRRPGRRRRDAEPRAAARVPHRRHRPHHRQQPDRLHHLARRTSRSSEYCTDVAKMIGAPIFHVNGDDPEAAVWVARLAVDYRQKFKKDVVIDMLCYRRRGHNEGDDPSMTQPAMYDVIDTKRGVRKTYTEALIGRGDISMKEAEDALRDYQGQLERVFNEVRELEKHEIEPSESVEADQSLPAAAGHRRGQVAAGPHRRRRTSQFPEGFTVHPRVKPVLEKRRRDGLRGQGRLGVRRAARAGLADRRGQAGPAVRPGHPARHVHAAALGDHRPQDRRRVHPAATAATNSDGAPTAAGCMVYDSALSEYAAVGFEYGYSVGNPDALVLWEAQFGDFVNGAQSIIDEFISSGEAKWGQQSDVVLLLPHGHEGQGPDHTSGRIERFLQLCAEGSMTVAVPSTPGELLPPAAAARAGRCAPPADRVHAEVDAAQQGRGQRVARLHRAASSDSVIEEPTYADGRRRRGEVKRILLTSGKIYYELAARKAKDKRDGRRDRAARAALPAAAAHAQRRRSTRTRTPTEFRWVQEEPANQGAWPTFGLTLPEMLPDGCGHQAGLAARDGGAVVGLVEGARGRAAGDHRRGVRLTNHFCADFCVRAALPAGCATLVQKWHTQAEHPQRDRHLAWPATPPALGRRW